MGVVKHGFLNQRGHVPMRTSLILERLTFTVACNTKPQIRFLQYKVAWSPSGILICRSHWYESLNGISLPQVLDAHSIHLVEIILSTKDTTTKDEVDCRWSRVKQNDQ